MRLHQKTVLQKTAMLVKAGMMEPPKWYAAIKRVPPFHRRPSNGIEQLKLPWDKLAMEFANRNPHMVDDPEWLGPNGYRPGAPPISYVFAKRQYALMQNGFKKEEAYKRTHDSMKAERAADVAAIRRMVKEASALSGSRPSFVADDDVYSGLRYWQTMMKETPYADWDLAAKEALNVFLRREVLDWEDEQMKFARSAKDGTGEAVEAEIKRLRITLFPETKSDEYAYPSDVIRPMEEEDIAKEIKEENETEFHDTEAYDEGEKEEWKSALLVGDWKDSLKHFREMAKEVPYELDWSPEDRQHLDNFIFGRCIRRAVLEEAFSWVPDPVADALAKIENEGSRVRQGGKGEGTEPSDSPPDAALEEKPPGDYGNDVDVQGEGVGRETVQAQEEAGIGDKEFQVQRPGEEEKQEVVKEENWLAGENLEGFDGDWMAVARRRTERGEQTALAKKVRKGRGKGKAAMAANAAGLEKNLKAVLTQAKRQLFPDLVLEEDEKGGKESPEARRERIEAKKKIVTADLDWENEEVEAERNAMISKLKAGIGPQKTDLLEEIRAKRLTKGTWKAERRRLLKLEKELYREQKSSLYEEKKIVQDSGEDELEDLPDTIFESEVLKNKAKEFYAKEKALMKKNAKLQAEAAAAGEELKARAKSKANN